MEQIVEEMGPVDDVSDRQPHTDEPRAAVDGTPGRPSGSRAPKRLYRIREGKIIAGVCNGIAAYFNIDPALVRIPFLVLAWTGIGVLAYFALMIILPCAETPEERAAAYGEPPFNAQEIIDQAKKTAAEFKDTADKTGEEWKRQWREQRRQWREHHRAWKQQWRATIHDRWAGGPWNPMAPAGYAPPAWVGLMTIFSIVSVALFVVLIASIVSLINTGALFGWALPAGIPVWGGIVMVLVLFQIVTAPIRVARHAAYYPWERYHGVFAVWDGLFSTAMTMLFLWLLYTHMPPTHDLREFMHNLPDAFRSLGREVSMWFRDIAEKLQ